MTGPPGRPAFCPAAPRDVARILLDGLLGEGSGRGGVERRRTRTRLTLTAFQRASLEDVRRVIAERRGAVLADSVGMGKTFVALALIAEALGAGRRVAVVVPTALLAQWRRELRRRVAVRELPETRSPGVVWYTHARLSRGAVAPEPAPLLVVVDEAHAFRSPATRRYRALASLCRDAEVLLMTATPVNNTLMDLYHLLRFFSGDGDYRDLGIADLGAEMRALAAGGLEGGGSRRLDALLRAVVVRRTRQQVRGRMGGDGAWKFPERAPPIVVRYELVTPTGASTDALVRKLAGLSLAPLRLREYGVRQLRGLGPGESELLRIGLLKRLASSLSAFRSSIRRQRRFYQEFLAALGRRKLLAPAEFRRLYGGDADVLQLVLEPVALGDLPGGVDVSRLAADTRADLEILDLLERDVAGVTPSNDPKLSRLRELLDGPLVGRRVVIFTEYRDTARVLWNALVAQGHVGLVDGSGALLGRHSSGRRAVVERFAPLSNGARPPPAHEAVHILIATDVLSEGLNLQDASHVVSYDLPWNPVRIAQRIGRLDRLGSPHATVHAWNFAPDAGLDAMLRLMTRLRRKLRAIAGSVGQDGPVLGTELHRDERVVARWAGGDASVLDDIERAETAPFLVVERLRALRRELAREPRKMPTPERPPRIPYAAIRDPAGPDGALVGVRAGSRFVWIFVRNDGSVDPDAVGAVAPSLERLVAGSAVPEVTDPGANGAVRVALAEALRRFADHGATLPVPRVAALAARRVRRQIRALPHGPDERTCRRVDRILASLTSPMDVGTELAVARALRTPVRRRVEGPLNQQLAPSPAAALDKLLAALEIALRIGGQAPDRVTAIETDGSRAAGNRGSAPELRGEAQGVPRVVAVLRIAGASTPPADARQRG